MQPHTSVRLSSCLFYEITCISIWHKRRQGAYKLTTSANACLHSDQRGITASRRLHVAKRTYMVVKGVASYRVAHKHTDTHTTYNIYNIYRNMYEHTCSYDSLGFVAYF